MKKTVARLALVVAAVAGFAATPANADVVYISSDGTFHNISETELTPLYGAPIVERTFINSAVVEPVYETHVLTQPAVIPTTVEMTQPVMIERVAEPRRSLFNLRLFPLFDFSLF